MGAPPLSSFQPTTYGNSVQTDGYGNIFITGQTTGAFNSNTRFGAPDFILAKYTSEGRELWTRQLGVQEKSTAGQGIALDGRGGVYVLGYTTGDLGGEKFPELAKAAVFVTKFDVDGNYLWTKLVGVAGKSAIGNGIAPDRLGNIFITGETSGDLDGDPLTGDPLTGLADVFITKLDLDGNYKWSRQMGVAGKNTSGSGIVVDGEGNVFIGGYTSGGLDGNSLSGFYDFFVAKYDTNGVKF